jgi:hypothetical protein
MEQQIRELEEKYGKRTLGAVGHLMGDLIEKHNKETVKLFAFARSVTPGLGEFVLRMLEARLRATLNEIEEERAELVKK